MYGTIFNLSVKPGHEQDLLEVLGGTTTPESMASPATPYHHHDEMLEVLIRTASLI